LGPFDLNAGTHRRSPFFALARLADDFGFHEFFPAEDGEDIYAQVAFFDSDFRGVRFATGTAAASGPTFPDDVNVGRIQFAGERDREGKRSEVES